MTGHFNNNNGAHQYFAVSLKDLICFQPVGFDQLAFGEGMPFFDWRSLSSSNLQHFAFEFDSTWKFLEFSSHGHCWDQGSIIGCISKALKCEGIHIWVIDYKASLNKADIPDDRQVFYGSRCRYVEIWRSDARWNYLIPDQSDALQLAERLDEAMKNFDRMEEYEYVSLYTLHRN